MADTNTEVVWHGAIIAARGGPIPFLAQVRSSGVSEFRLSPPLRWEGPCRGTFTVQSNGNNFVWNYNDGEGRVDGQYSELGGKRIIMGVVFEGQTQIGLIFLVEAAIVKEFAGGWDT